jgi:hypothetical protein
MMPELATGQPVDAIEPLEREIAFAYPRMARTYT